MRGDLESIAALVETNSIPRFEYQSELAGEAFRGIEGWRAFLAAVRETFLDFTSRPRSSSEAANSWWSCPDAPRGEEREAARPPNCGST
jgi:hypothetical protein